MSTQTICRYTSILLFNIVFALSGSHVYAQEADSVGEKKPGKLETGGRQVVIGIDIFHPLIDHYSKNNRRSYELCGDYYLRKEFYAVSEVGWGSSSVTYANLSYSTSDKYMRVGFNKCMLTRHSPQDWDMMFIGMRAAVSAVRRSDASYIVTDSLWGSAAGIYPGKNFAAVWAEITAGMRMELWKGIFAGWNLRAKFMFNGRSFKGLAPEYIAGYGKGDKNNGFDFNVYLSYGIRWRR